MITTTEQVNELVKKATMGLSMTDAALVELRALVEAGRKDKRKLVREIYEIQMEEMTAVMKGE